MKKHIILSTLIIAILTLGNTKAQNLVPNPSFESWSSETKVNNWNLLNFLSLINMGELKRSSDAQDGSYAAQLITKTIPANPFLGIPEMILPGVLATGQIDPSAVMELIGLITDGEFDFSDLLTPENINTFTNALTGGVIISEAPTSLEGYYKYTPATEGERCLMGVIFYGNVSGNRTPIGISFYTDSVSSTTYKYFSTSITYLVQDVIPNEMIVIAVSSASINATEGSSLLIDNFSTINSFVKATPVSPNNDFSFKISPNPSSGTICLNISKNEKINVRICNLVGQVIWSSDNYKGGEIININKRGIYLVQVTTVNGISKTHKVIIK